MQCHQVEDLISAYIDGELEDSEKQYIQQHVVYCRDCARLFNGILTINKALEMPDDFAVPVELTEKLERTVNEKFVVLLNEGNTVGSKQAFPLDKGQEPTLDDRMEPFGADGYSMVKDLAKEDALADEKPTRTRFALLLKLASAFTIIVIAVAITIAGGLYFSDMQPAESEGFVLKEKPDDPTTEDLLKAVPKDSSLEPDQIPFFPGGLMVSGEPSKEDIELLAAKLQQAAEKDLIAEAAKELKIDAPLEAIKDAVMIRPNYKPADPSQSLGLIALVNVDVKINDAIDESLAYDLSTLLIYKLWRLDSRLIPSHGERLPWLEGKPRVPMEIIIELNNARTKYMHKQDPTGSITEIYRMEDGTEKVFKNGELVE